MHWFAQLSSSTAHCYICAHKKRSSWTSLDYFIFANVIYTSLRGIKLCYNKSILIKTTCRCSNHTRRMDSEIVKDLTAWADRFWQILQRPTFLPKSRGRMGVSRLKLSPQPITPLLQWTSQGYLHKAHGQQESVYTTEMKWPEPSLKYFQTAFWNDLFNFVKILIT